ncbi:MAG: DHHW family protein [Oscillospiraceae bacterium]|nr:DHHW family protein [Oscillospiraceae bacterium]
MRKQIIVVLLFILLALLLSMLALLTVPLLSKKSAPPADLLQESSTEAAAPVLTGKTDTPKLIDCTFLARDRYCVAGRGEEGAAVRVEGGISPAYAKVLYGQFIVEVFVEKNEAFTLELYAASPNKKEESEPLIVPVDSGGKRSDRPIHVGKDNHLHYSETIADFLGNSLFGEGELDQIRQWSENLQQQLFDAGLTTQVIFFVSPSHNTIYPETMPDFWADLKVGDNSRLKQLTAAFKNSTVKFINPYDRLMKEKQNYFLYNRSDTHWNELGAYFGYCEIFDYIGESFPAAKPLPLSAFDMHEANVRGGDLIPMLEFDQELYRETAPIMRIKNPTVKELFRGDTEEIAYQEGFYHQYHDYQRNDASKPTILMYRDSFSISMMAPIAETSDRSVFYHMWNYDIDVNYVKEINPDFLIIQRVERSLGDTANIFWKFRK